MSFNCFSELFVAYLGETDSTIAPPQSQRSSLTNVSWLLGTRKATIEKKGSVYFLVCKGLSIDDIGVSTDTVVRDIRPGAGFEAGDFVIEKSGGYRRTTRD